jgi:hypothetical protein
MIRLAFCALRANGKQQARRKMNFFISFFVCGNGYQFQVAALRQFNQNMPVKIQVPAALPECSPSVLFFFTHSGSVSGSSSR